MLTAWGAWGLKRLYGREVVGVTRSTVLIDAEGRVGKVWRRVQAKKHADQVLTAPTRFTG